MVQLARGHAMAEPPAVLRSAAGIPVPLERVSARGHLNGLLFELTVEQRYSNRSAQSIEAVFTFPLPFRAVLLGFDLEIGERRLSAHAVPRAAASEKYERAIDAGDTAALIEHDGHGLHTVSLGNLQPGEAAVIRYRYAELLDAYGGYVRVNVPTVIAPRYGDPRDAGLDGPTVPGVDLFAEYPFEIHLELAGLASAASVRSPSHAIRTQAAEHGLLVRLEQSGYLDRDFVLEIEQAVLPTQALLARDGDGYVLLASATLAVDQAERRPLALKILLDCSGSMAGNSIAAAKRAVLAILARLTPEDRVSITRFGSTVEHVTEGLEPADSHTLEPLQVLVKSLEADLGGTEMEKALIETLGIPTTRDRTADLILITDGEIYGVVDVVERSARSGHRLFAIGIGAAPVEPLARALGEKTGGGCELVGPGEDPEAAILRTFKRLRSAPRVVSDIDWTAAPSWTAPPPSAVFPGDTLHAIAGFASLPTGALGITVRDDAGQDTQLHVSVSTDLMPGDLLPRLAAARRLVALEPGEARELAVKYQLATAQTSFVVVAVRADGEKADGLPATLAVSHMFAAGWGGSAREPAADCEQLHSETVESRVLASRLADDDVDFELAMFEAEELNQQRFGARPPFTPADRENLLLSLAGAYGRGEALPRRVEELKARHGLAEPACIDLFLLLDEGSNSEEDIVRVFLALLAEDAAAADMDAKFLQALRGDITGSRAYRALRRRVRARLFR